MAFTLLTFIVIFIIVTYFYFVTLVKMDIAADCGLLFLYKFCGKFFCSKSFERLGLMKVLFALTRRGIYKAKLPAVNDYSISAIASLISIEQIQEYSPGFAIIQNDKAVVICKGYVLLLMLLLSVEVFDVIELFISSLNTELTISLIITFIIDIKLLKPSKR